MSRLSLLDTSAVLAHHRQEQGWERVQAIFEEEDHEVLLCALTLTELSRRLSALGADLAAIEGTIRGYREAVTRVVAIDEEVAWLAFQAGRRTPERLPLADALIAACAARHGACLVHRDRHMAAIPNAVVDQVDLVGG